MTPPETNDDRLEELRQRWEEEPGSRIFLQLAEEYRHRGRHQEALEVLGKGLEAHPHQVSGLVALGRVQLELENPGEAARALEKALDIDATNAMAMKLAVKAYLQQGDRDQAKQRLELYKLLNASDDEIETLEARVAGRAPATPAPPAPEAAPPSPPGAVPGPAAGAEGPGLSGAEGDTAARPQHAAEPETAEPETAETETAEPETAEPGTEPEIAPREAAPAGPAPSASAPDGEVPPAGGTGPEGRETASPSAPLHAGGDVWSPTAAWPGLPRDVGADAAGAETGSAPPAEEAAGERPEGDPAAAPPPEPSAAGPEPFGELLAAGERRRYLEGLGSEGLFPVELEPEPEPEAAPQPSPPPEAPAPGLPPEGEAALEPPLRTDAPAGEAPHELPADEPPAAEPPAEEPSGPAGEAVPTPAPELPEEGAPEGAPLPAPVAPAAAAGDRPTVTLGQLYLDQGHPEEAQRIFEAVLDREPENVQARIGLLRARASAATAKRKQQEGGETEPVAGEEAPVPSAPEPGLPPGAEAVPEEGAEPPTAAEPAAEAAGEPEPPAPLETRRTGIPSPAAAAEDENGWTVESAEPEEPAAPPAGEGWEQPAAAADRLQESAPPAEPATGGLAESTRTESGSETSPPLTAADLLRDADPSEPPKKALLDAYLARLRGRSS